MSFSYQDFYAIDSNSIESFLGRPEDVELEFKRDSYGNADSDKREFLKDISAMANVQSIRGRIVVDASLSR